VDDDALEIRPDIFCCNSDCLDSLLKRPFVTVRIRSNPGFEIMRKAVNLNGNRCRLTEKIEHVRPERMLPAKIQALRTQS